MLMAAKRSTGSAAMVQVAIGYEDNRESTYADMESNMSEKNYYLELLSNIYSHILTLQINKLVYNACISFWY